jgi:hypothetical protein
MPSQGCDVGRRVNCRVESGQASPREVASRVVREAGQIGARPSIKTDQRIGRGTMGMEEARVLGWERR